MKADLSELMSNLEAFEAYAAAVSSKAKEINTSVPDFDAVIRLAAEPDRDTRRSRESLEALVQQNAELLKNQQKQIDENRDSSEKNAIATRISIAIAAGSFALAAIALLLR